MSDIKEVVLVDNGYVSLVYHINMAERKGWYKVHAGDGYKSYSIDDLATAIKTFVLARDVSKALSQGVGIK